MTPSGKKKALIGLGVFLGVLALLIIIAFVVWKFVLKPPKPNTTICSTNADCSGTNNKSNPDATVCWVIDNTSNKGVCVVPCGKLVDGEPVTCPDGWTCGVNGVSAGQCLPPPPCSVSNPCGIGYACITGNCAALPNCSVDTPCAPGSTCVSGFVNPQPLTQLV